MKDNKIRALVMDIDGTLTDGGIYIGDSGEIMKRFHVRDGYGIKHILSKLEILPIVITGRESDIVKQRCMELGITKLVQGSTDKLNDMLKILESENIKLEETAYIGDDLNDLECMQKAGIRGCPADAVTEIRAIADYIALNNGGYGAVREFIEWIEVNT